MLDTKTLTEKLGAEKTKLLAEIQELTLLENEGNPEFNDETAERLEEQEDRTAAADTLKTRLAEVEAALERVTQGTYGQCLRCGQTIESDRLEANPAATTCKQHLN